MSTSEEVYAKELFRCGKGYPLWQPEATEDDVEVQLGDVGYLDKGGFCRLFNACRDKHDRLNNKPRHVPDAFVPFPVDLSPKRTHSAVGAGPLLSRSVTRVGGRAEVAAYSGQASFEFECVDSHGACVVVGSSAPREEFHQTRRLKEYMKQNIDSWVHYATEVLGIEKKLDDILFVKGYVKTTHWAVAAFLDRARSAKVNVSGGFGSVADAGLGLVVVSNSSSVDHHTGPEGRRLQAPQSSSKYNKKRKNREQLAGRGSKAELRQNQCIFLHYFKMKRRFALPTKIQAAAEPKDEPSSHEDDDFDSDEVPVTKKPYDPVDYVLDYILKYSEASEAIASDGDILELCNNNKLSEYPIPDDISAFLESAQPEIEVTSDGLGMLLFDDDITTEHLAKSVALALHIARNAQFEQNAPEHRMVSLPDTDWDSTPSQSGTDDSYSVSDHDDESICNDDTPDNTANMEDDTGDTSLEENGDKNILDYTHIDDIPHMPSKGW